MGTLAVSRAFGDRELKESKISKRLLIVDPEITTVELVPILDEFIILATDGLWDVMSSQAAVDMVQTALSNLKGSESDFAAVTPTELAKIGDQMANHAVKNLSSQDNVTVMIIHFLPTRTIFKSTSRASTRALDGLSAGHSFSSVTSHASSISAGSSSFHSYEKEESIHKSTAAEMGKAPTSNITGPSRFGLVNYQSMSKDATAGTDKKTSVLQEPTPYGEATTTSVIEGDDLDFLLDDSNF
jgi:hypothetical protein